MIIVISSFEEWLSLENHSCEHASCTPYIQLVIIMSHTNKQLRPFEVPRCNPAIELFAREVKVCQTPISNPHLLLLVIYEHVSWLNISVDDSIRMGKI